MRGHRTFGLLLCAAVLVTAIGVGATRFVKSPQDALAEAAAPSSARLTAQVERRVLRDTVVLRGTVVAGGTFEVTPAVGDSIPVVTAVRVSVGTDVSVGQVILEVAGRPLIALSGDIPVYRDLRPGMSGRDVAQLQKALRGLGHQSADVDGTFGSGTKKALSAFYSSLGYDVPMNPAATADAVDAAERAVTAAERAAQQARTNLSRLLTANASPAPTRSANAIADARLALAYATEDLKAAEMARNDVQIRYGPALPASEVVFLPSFPARVDTLKAKVGARVEAPLVTLSSGQLVVRAKLNGAQRGLLKENMPVRVVSELSNKTVNATISAIGGLTEDAAAGGRSYPMVIRPTAKASFGGLLGEDVRLTVEAASTDGEVLVVPVSALYTSADGQVAVLRVNAGGADVPVAVTASVSGDGYVAVEAARSDDGLNAGDTVVVGGHD
ncbi:HlyD family efflux transporter periplasmic adaptor subunit [Micromonospora sp. ALFpr18c]|uniref:peptidoglycan-binding protein n=1 Tax=Micromonospora sp. ALFpr18c TaxID=1458665 RepID=UPI00124B2EEE|nr:peptidoglycan-binding protein [Micromonospora sp. ALFpr18c]KAB1943422.1 HlyD family efflux transporter periplasmic adaptor subunit [Micromonospora sp. ALFpr18c]